MRENRRNMKIIKVVMAVCLILNNFSGIGPIVKAATIEQHKINSSLNNNNNNNMAEDMEVDDSVGKNDSEEILPNLPDSEEMGREETPDLNLPGEDNAPSDEEQPPITEEERPLEPSEDLEDSKEDQDNENLEEPEGELVPEEEVQEELELDEEEAALLSLDSRSAGSGLIQLWQIVPDGQQSKENKTTSEIMKALKCKPNHNLYPLSGGQSEHNTYVNSCYVDDVFYLGEDSNYYHIYLSGYEGKVPKSESHWFELDLNNDGKKVSYEIRTVAYYIPAASTYTINEIEEKAILDVPELNFYDETLDKYNNFDEMGVELYSISTVQSPSYYVNDNGTLYHYITSNVTKANSYSKIIAGKAPSWMSQGVKYYSYDGIYFYTNWNNIRVNGQGAVNQNNPFYNYYQYLPFRSKSNYAANMFNNYTNSNGGAGGKLVNAGQYFYAVQDKYGINGGLQYAMGIHESGWGKSSLSMDKNNLFGMNATDNNPYGNGTSFPSVEAGINYHADRYLSWGYTDPIDDYRYFGSHVGNKGSGLNVKYASDPFWGEKIAGWYYRFDNAGGLKDYNYYTIGIKQSNVVVDIKSQANSGSSTLYHTKNKKSNFKIVNYPFLIIGDQNGFYKVKTDTPIINGTPKFSAQYNWYSTYGFVSKNSISTIVNNNVNYRDPHVVTTLNVDSVEMNHSIMINGWMITEGVNVASENSQTKELIILNQSNKEVLRVTGKATKRTDVTGALGSRKYNYDYAGFSFELTKNQVSQLTEGSYKMIIQTTTDGIVQQKPFIYSKALSGSVNGIQVTFENSVMKVNYDSPRSLDSVTSSGKAITIKGWGYLRGIELPEQNSVVKAVILVNEKGQEVYRKNAQNTLRTDVTQVMGQGLNYNYSGYEIILGANELNLPVGTYSVLLEVNTKGVYKTQPITGVTPTVTMNNNMNLYTQNQDLYLDVK